MRVPQVLAEAFSEKYASPFEKWLGEFLTSTGFLESEDALYSDRFLNRSVIPHLEKLSGLFNREGIDQSTGIKKYWQNSSNPTNLRLAYFLYFMPCNLFRVASIFAEMNNFGFDFSTFRRAIELGAGPASGACGFAATNHYILKDHAKVNWALVEQDKGMLDLGVAWSTKYFENLGLKWPVDPFRRELNFATAKGVLPRSAPSFDLFVMSYILNEIELEPKVIADTLTDLFRRHLNDNGLVLLCEPALKLQSRKLLEVRGYLSQEFEILLPCFGNQECGAFKSPEDWCHEEVLWWRPSYLKKLDDKLFLDHKTLPFSYLVLSKVERAHWFKNKTSLKGTHRLVSPPYEVGKNYEFYVCGADGKSKKRRAQNEGELMRGDVI